MAKVKFISIAFFVLLFIGSKAQNIKDETVDYRYIKLPLSPLPSSVKNYQSSIFAPYEEENKKKKAEYDAKQKAAEIIFQKEKEAYPSKVKQAEDKYNAEMVEWKKKSLGEKVVEKKILGENNKPVLYTPSPPYMQNVPLPDLRTSYDYPVLANSYIMLDGYANKNENPIKIDVTIYGYDYTEPRQMSEQKNVASYANGQTSTSIVNYYHTEFSYRHTMSVKVTAPDGKELFNLTPQELNSYKIFKTPASTAAEPINSQMLVKTYEEKILQENLTLINNLVNDKIGYKRVLRKVELNYVKSKDETYKDLLIAFNDGSSGLKILIEDEASAKTKLENAINLWKTALLESDPKNKKARIDKDVTIAIYFNLLECYFATNNTIEADKIMIALNSMDINSSKRKLKDDYESLFNDLKKRALSNK